MVDEVPLVSPTATILGAAAVVVVEDVVVVAPAAVVVVAPAAVVVVAPAEVVVVVASDEPVDDEQLVIVNKRIIITDNNFKDCFI